MQKTDKQGKNVMWCFVEFEEIVQAARCMKVLQVSLITSMLSSNEIARAAASNE